MTTIACGRTSRRAAATATIVALVLTACGGTDDAPPTTAPTTSTSSPAPTTTTTIGAPTDGTTSTTTGDGDAATCPDGGSSSSEAFDPDAGTVAALIVSFEPPTVELDPIAWLVGSDAVDAYLEDHPGESEGPPNDVYTRNDDPTLHTAPLADDATISLLAFDDGVVNVAATASELADRLAEPSGPFWVTVAAGTVVEVCEQYTP